MTQDQQRMQQLQADAVLFTRNKLNAGVQAAGLVTSRWISRWSVKIIVGFILLHIVLFLNISLGFALGSWSGDSPAMGFLYLSGIYAVLSLLVYLCRGFVRRMVRRSVAESFIEMDEALNQEMDANPWLHIDRRYTRRPKVTDRIDAYEALVQARGESSLVADQAMDYLEKDINYFRYNYKSIVARQAASQVSQSIPYGRFLSPIISWVANQFITPRGANYNPKEMKATPNKGKTGWQKVSPYLSVAVEVVRPLLVAYLGTRAKNWVSTLFSGKKIKKRR